MIKVPALSCQKEALSGGPITRVIDLSQKLMSFCQIPNELFGKS